MDAISLHAALLGLFLGHPSFDTREVASAAIVSTPPPVLLLLAQHPDAEVRHRVSRQVSCCVWACLACEWDRRGWPWVDAITDLPWLGLDMPRESADQGDSDWPEYKRATRIWLRWQIEAGRAPAELHQLLTQAEERCAYWRVHRRYP